MPEGSSEPSRRVVYRGRKLDLALQPIILADGTRAERELVVHRGAVALVPMVDSQHVCLVKNHRHAIGESLLELPAGTIDEGETPERTAQRELAEETGYHAARLTFVRQWFVSPGVMTERMFLFLCQDLSPGPTRPELDEQLETLVVPWADALEMARDGRIRDAKSILGLFLCDLLRNQG